MIQRESREGDPEFLDKARLGLFNEHVNCLFEFAELLSC